MLFWLSLHTTTSERKYHRLIRCLLCQQHNPAYYTCQSSYRRSYPQLASIRRRPDFIVQTGTEPRAEIHFAGSFTLGNASTIGNRMYTEFGSIIRPKQSRLPTKKYTPKLAALQSPTGGWSWFKGMYPSRFMTANVLAIMARANLTGQRAFNEQEKEMQIKALRYLDNEIRKDFETTPQRIGYEQILYLYVRSLYRDIPLGDALKAHKIFYSISSKAMERFHSV